MIRGLRAWRLGGWKDRRREGKKVRRLGSEEGGSLEVMKLGRRHRGKT